MINVSIQRGFGTLAERKKFKMLALPSPGDRIILKWKPSFNPVSYDVLRVEHNLVTNKIVIILTN